MDNLLLNFFALKIICVNLCNPWTISFLFSFIRAPDSTPETKNEKKQTVCEQIVNSK